MKAVIPLLTLAAILPACHKSRSLTTSPTPAANDLAPGDFVSTFGTREQRTGTETSKLTLSPTAGGVQWRIETRTPSVSLVASVGTMTLKDPVDPWFAYMQQAGRFWFCNGSDTLTYTITEDVINRGHNVISEGKLLPGAPTPPVDVIQRLPENLRQLYPGTGTPAARPSI